MNPEHIEMVAMDNIGHCNMKLELGTKHNMLYPSFIVAIRTNS
jgi:hypothetical protein